MGELDEKVTEAAERGQGHLLNSIVAVMVALAATAMAIDNVKDGNVGQAMAQAQAKAVDNDQFDLSDAAFSLAIALLGISVLTKRRWLIGMAGIFLAVGFVFSAAGFFNWPLHPDRIMSWLS